MLFRINNGIRIYQGCFGMKKESFIRSGEKNGLIELEVNLNNVDYDPCAFAKSLPLLNNNNQNSNIGNGTNNRMRINMNHKKSQL